MEHLERQVSHPRQIDQRFDRRVQQISLRRLADIDGEVADALQIGVDLDHRHDGSQIDRHGLVQGKERETSIVDFDLQIVDA